MINYLRNKQKGVFIANGAELRNPNKLKPAVWDC